ncbi:uncharacterized protein BP01DRAFT_408515 [Aspergillus saccharolyticus JOP 1030-1]|uniref:F-box domain-containing protein n=1 Tax=Aspergillus saccharolyticus JOP 1030-1 TaxID=1450539 RepID=A0A318ZBY4_9EURO|nr:hypothetical protein BP01DRAFT_408515 [Aspergillus saccharolyticus JOP 1030-1]PYH40990.1 hypothetical protein BP01DRAFT_408515 [Aspergillus saccharolyticus JOP 1030-1]
MLSCLPTELLFLIVEYVNDQMWLLDLSMVNKQLREICSPAIFETLVVKFTKMGLLNLIKASESPLSRYVRCIRYEAAEILDPMVQYPEIFRSCIYTPDDYVRDWRDTPWRFRSRSISYSMIYAYFCVQARDQQDIIDDGLDTKALSESLPRFIRLHTIELRFMTGLSYPYEWLASQALIDNSFSFSDHFKKLMMSMILAKESGVLIQNFKVSGFYTSFNENKELCKLAEEAFSNIQTIHVLDSPTMLDCFSKLSIPFLRRLELANCWLSISSLETFIQAHAETLRFLHLEEIWLLDSTSEYDHLPWDTGSTDRLLHRLEHIFQLGILSGVTINSRNDGQFEV